jgi:hypothetical protein
MGVEQTVTVTGIKEDEVEEVEYLMYKIPLPLLCPNV